MGASDSKIGFKQGIFRLSEERNIAANDAYWTSFWELPESSEDVFSLFSPNDIRRTRDNALENIETLIQALTTRVFTLRHHPSFPDPDHAPERDILNCIRVLTRILPYLYEKESLGPWEEQFLWTPRRIKGRTPKAEVLFDEAQEGKEPVQSSAETNENLKPLAEELIDTLVDLLFFSDFTLPRQPNGQSKTLKYNPASWRVPYNTLVFRDTKQVLVTYSIHFLLAMLIYPIPEDASSGSHKNYFRHFLGRIHRPQDFQFIVDGMTRILNQPLQEKSSYIPGSQSSSNLAPEVLMLFWELIQCNKRFRSFIIDTDRAHDFVVLALFYALEYRNEPSKQGVVRMCAFLLQTLSVEASFGSHLNKTFEGQESLPASIRINAFRGTYADFLLHSIYTLITTSQGNFAPVYPALLAIINNIAPHIEGLSASSGSQLMHLFSLMASPSFLLANETNHGLLHSLLDSINSILENKYRQNPELIMAIFKNKKRIEALRTFTLETGQEEIEKINRRRKDAGGHTGLFDDGSRRSSVDSVRSPSNTLSRTQSLEEVPEDSAFAVGDDDDDDSDEEPQPTPAASTASENPSQASSVTNVEDAVPVQLRGMSEKARGKMPANIQSFSRQNSSTSLGAYSNANQAFGGSFEPTAPWIDSWLPELPLHTILTIIQQTTSVLPRQASARDAAADTLRRIQKIEFIGLEPSAIRVHSFEWSQLALGWYESLLWGVIFASEMQIAKGTMGIWNGTAIKLFRVQETAPAGPTLTSPRGAVDAVGSNIVSRIGQINLRGASAASNSAPNRGAS
ncbi:uncharacterized protein TRIVIDRAFT_73445 [Trichoderma virens Gv29-8]|uniref:High-temperature-induced dauer-formation protein n=1 Tax=Hypocrea virens (strain Gv29-8 / FGSC 10586) TaxID=413071 RepID=G9MH07_HYPVG|nr:uncharacterized protein TRIVIDRAFT_73445 [Trichoderma virens Gv29-8]EHK25999.1 hypothetical protein TRIVIDRAFT_73445 [Trichoderma virens Gv29-8]UKZ46177.1 hypothetical protein TrVGV298_000376 [Trichoderma virens]